MSTPQTPLPPGSFLHFVLWLGDSGLATLLAAAIVLALAVPNNTRRIAIFWAALFTLTTALVFATKLGLFGWGHGIPQLDFRGPSGHATVSALVWPVVAWVLTSHTDSRMRCAALTLSVAIALGVTWVLIAYGFHTAAEAAAGTLLGGSGAYACIRVLHASDRPRKLTTTLIAVSVAVLVWMQHGQPLAPLVQFKRKAHQLVALNGIVQTTSTAPIEPEPTAAAGPFRFGHSPRGTS